MNGNNRASTLMKYKIKTTGLFLREVFEQNRDLFYSRDPWWIGEKFADEKPQAGEYEFLFDEKTRGKNFSEQKEMIEKEMEIPHIAIVTEALINHYKNTGERLLRDWRVRTGNIASDGHCVYVGLFDSGGLRVNLWDDDGRHNSVGLSAARKLSSDTGNLESRVQSLESDMEELKKFLII